MIQRKVDFSVVLSILRPVGLRRIWAGFEQSSPQVRQNLENFQQLYLDYALLAETDFPFNLAHKNIEKGDYEVALEIYDSILNKHPRHLKTLEARMQLYKKMERVVESEVDAQEIKGIKTEHENYAKQYKVSLEAAQNICDFKFYVQHRHPMLIWLLPDFAMLYMGKGNRDLVHVYNNALIYLQGHQTAKRSSSECYAQGSKFEKLGNLNMTIVQYFSAIAYEVEDEISELKEAQQKVILNAFAKYEKKSLVEAKGSEKKGSESKDVDAFSHRISQNPNVPDYYYKRAQLNLAQGNYPTLLTDDGSVSLIDHCTPGSVLGDLYTGLWLKKVCKKESTISLIDYYVLARDAMVKLCVPKNANAIQIKIISTLREKLAGASDAGRKALGQQGDNSCLEYTNLLLDQAKIEMADDNLNRAIHLLDFAKKVFPRTEKVDIYLASLYCRVYGDFDKAKKVYEEALDAFKNQSVVLPRLEQNYKNFLAKIKQYNSPKALPKPKKDPKPQNVFPKESARPKPTAEDLEAEAKASQFRKELIARENAQALENEIAYQAEQKQKATEKAERERLKREKDRAKRKAKQKKLKDQSKAKVEFEASSVSQADSKAESKSEFKSDSAEPISSATTQQTSSAIMEKLEEKKTVLSVSAETKTAEVKVTELKPYDISSCIEHEILSRLQREKLFGLMVGGKVLERLSGKPNNRASDIDIIASGTAKDMMRIFSDLNIIEDRYKQGKLFKIFMDDGQKIEIYLSNDLTEASSPENISQIIKDNALGRDFTVSAIFSDVNGNFHVPLGQSVADFYARKLETIIPAEQSFEADPIRMLRVCHLAVKYGLKISDDIKAAIKSKGHLLLEKANKGHVNSWVNKLLTSEGFVEKFDIFIKLGLLEHLFPSIAPALIQNRNWIKSELSKLKATHSAYIDKVYMILLKAVYPTQKWEEVEKLIPAHPLFAANFASKGNIGWLHSTIPQPQSVLTSSLLQSPEGQRVSQAVVADLAEASPGDFKARLGKS